MLPTYLWNKAVQMLHKTSASINDQRRTFCLYVMHLKRIGENLIPNVIKNYFFEQLYQFWSIFLTQAQKYRNADFVGRFGKTQTIEAELNDGQDRVIQFMEYNRARQ